MDNAKLKALIIERKLPIGSIAGKIGVSVSTFSKKLNGRSEFTQSEMVKLIDLLNITDPVSIFFAK